MEFRHLLVCPDCRSQLTNTGTKSICPRGHAGYNWVEGRAVFLKNEAPSQNPDTMFNQGLLQKLNHIPVIWSILKVLFSIDVVYKSMRSRDRIPQLARRFAEKQALNVGSGSTNYGDQFVNLDIGPYPNVHVVSPSDRLPFADETFDLIVCQAVLEHVAEPDKTVREMIRVLRTGGELYAEIPFLQGFHPTPNDYQRYTITGIEFLFRGIDRVDKGVVNGPSSALAWMLREYCSILFSCSSQTLYKIGSVVFGILFVPLKYLDIVLEKSRFAPIIACGLFFHGKKNSNPGYR